MDVLKISPKEAYERLAAGEPMLFLDARSPRAYEASNEQIADAVRVPVDATLERSRTLPHDRTLVAYCT
jgi:rhodanese-related sulfurtransferase